MRFKNVLVPFVLLQLAGNWAQGVEFARVNGKAITDNQMKAALGGLNEGQRQGVLKDENTRRQIVNSLVEQELVGQEAERQKLDEDSSVREGLEAVRKQYLGTVYLEKKLKEQLTDKAARKYYDANKDRYSTDVVRAHHVLLATEEEAKAVLAEVQKDGVDFQQVAEKKSKDPSAKTNRGDLGFFGRDRMVPEFTSAAFAAKAGEIVGPVKTSYGYHIIKVVEKKLGKALPWEDVEMRVKNDYRNQLVKNLVGDLRKSAKVEIKDSAISTYKP